nr:hypothetical protein BgiMline_006224 [Biomphalaria glabrata]
MTPPVIRVSDQTLQLVSPNLTNRISKETVGTSKITGTSVGQLRPDLCRGGGLQDVVFRNRMGQGMLLTRGVWERWGHCLSFGWHNEVKLFPDS